MKKIRKRLKFSTKKYVFDEKSVFSTKISIFDEKKRIFDEKIHIFEEKSVFSTKIFFSTKKSRFSIVYRRNEEIRARDRHHAKIWKKSLRVSLTISKWAFGEPISKNWIFDEICFFFRRKILNLLKKLSVTRELNS